MVTARSRTRGALTGASPPAAGAPRRGRLGAAALIALAATSGVPAASGGGGAAGRAAAWAAPLPTGVTIVRDVATGFTIEYAPPPAVLEPVPAAPGEVRVVVAGHRPRATAGEPDLPGTFLHFGYPSGAEPRVTVESVEFAPLGVARVAPVPATAGTFDEPALRYEKDPAAYAPEAPFPAVPAALGDAFRMGPQRVGSVLLWPVRWNPRTGFLEEVRRLRARVDFAGGGVRPRSLAPVALRESAETRLRALLANYETARALRDPLPAPKAPGLGARQEDSFASSSDWVRVKIATKGVYEITYEDLVAAGISDPGAEIGSTATLRLYGAGGLDLPEPLTDARPTWMRQVPILLREDGDGRLEAGEAVLFYALGPEGFLNEFDPGLPDTVHFRSRFTNENVYWLTWGGTFTEPAARMTPPIDGAPRAGSGATPALRFLRRTHEEQDIIEDYTRFGEDGYFWADFRIGAERRFLSSSPGADPSLPATLKVRLFGHRQTEGGTGSSYLGNVEWNDSLLGGQNFTWNDRLDSQGVRRPFDFVHTGLLATGRADTLLVRILAPTNSPYSADVYMTWFELAYERRYDALGQKSFLFTSPQDTGLVRYDVAGFSGSAPLLIDVTDPFAQRLVTGAAQRGDTVSFEVREASRRRYALWDETAILSPAEIQPFPIQNLRDPSLQAEYLMIVADPLRTAAERLRAHRSRDLRVLAVPLSQIVAQFGWGIPDPTAIRDFIQYAVANWDEGRGPGVGVVPEMVVLVGDATKDYRGLRQSTNKNLMLAHYRVSPDGSSINTFAADDWYTYLMIDGVYDDLPDVAIGRMPASSAGQLQTMITKIIQYESEPELGPWRSRLTFVADDEMKGCGNRSMASVCWDRAFYQRHTNAVEEAAAIAPDNFEHVKVYLMEYPFGNEAEKPAAKQAYLAALKRGTLISHYSGHGSFDKLADENVFFSSEADAVKLQNGKRYYIFTAYSCSVGLFDDGTLSSLSERLLYTPGGGSVAAFAADAPAFDEASTTLAREFLRAFLVPPGAGERLPMGEAVRVGKTVPVSFRSRVNDEKYNVLGDPGLRLGIPKLLVGVDPHGPFISARLDTVSGSVLDGDSVATWFDGTASVTVEGVADTSGYIFFPPGLGSTPDSTPVRVRYRLSGGTLFRGDVPVVNGRWKAAFYVPVDLRAGNLALVRTYVQNGVVDGLGVRDSIPAVRTSALDPGAASDRTGPAMEITLDGRPYRPGLTVLTGAQIAIRLSDPHGINLQGDDNFFAITVTLDEGSAAEKTQNLTGDFQYDAGRNDRGELLLALSAISLSAVTPGPHRLTLQSSDNLNNRTVLHLEIVVVDVEPEFRVTRAQNFPNPFSDRTQIHYTLTQNADVTVRIFTVNGRLIREFRNVPCGSVGENECLEWDGLDQDGDEIANGVYFFKVLARSVDSSAEGEAIGKAVVLRR